MYVATGVVLATLLGGLAIWTTGGLRPRAKGPLPVERAKGGRLMQRDGATGDVLWELVTGDVVHEAGSSLVQVANARCLLYTEGREEMTVSAASLLVDADRNLLTFDEGVEAESGGGAQVPYQATANRLLYYIEEREARFEEEARFDYGRTRFHGSVVDAWFEPIEGKRTSRLSWCEVTPLPPSDGKRAVIALLALTAAGAAQGAWAQESAPAQEQRFSNAIVRADRIVADVAGGVIRLLGDPEIEIGETVMTAESVDVSINPDSPDEVLSAESFGDVKVTSEHVIEEASMTRVRKVRTAVITARKALYTSTDRTARLTGGVHGTMKQPRLPESVFDATEIVSWFDEAGTLTKVVATGAPATAEAYFENASDQSVDGWLIKAASIDYLLSKPPQLIATGSPSISEVEGADTYSAGRMVVYFAETAEGGVASDRVELLDGFHMESRSEEGLARIESGSAVMFSGNADDPGTVEAHAGSLEPAELSALRGLGAKGGYAVIRGSPRVSLADPQTEEVTTVVTCDHLLDLVDQSKLVADGSVRIESLRDGTVCTGSRAVADSSEEAGKGRYLLTGDVHVSYPAKEEGRRPIEATAASASYSKPSSEQSVLTLEQVDAVVKAAKEGQDDIRVIAPHIEMDRKSGDMLATRRPEVRTGDSSFQADEVRLKLDPDTNRIKDGTATGNLKFHGRLEQKPKEGATGEAAQPKFRIVDGTAQRATFVPEVPLPSDVPNVTEGDVGSRLRLTGNPEVTVTDEATGKALLRFRNVEYIDVYRKDRSTFIASGGAGGGPAEVTVRDDKTNGGDGR